MRACRNSPSRGCRRPSEARQAGHAPCTRQRSGPTPASHGDAPGARRRCADACRVCRRYRDRSCRSQAMTGPRPPAGSRELAMAVTIKHSPAESMARRAFGEPSIHSYSVREPDDQREYEARQNKNDLQDPRLQFVVHKFTLTDSTAAGREHCTLRCRSVTTSHGRALALRESVRQCRVPRYPTS